MTDRRHDPVRPASEARPTSGIGGTADPLTEQIKAANPARSEDFAHMADFDVAMAACNQLLGRQPSGSGSTLAQLLRLRPAVTFRAALAACALVMIIPVVGLLNNDGDPTEEAAGGDNTPSTTLGAPPTTGQRALVATTVPGVVGDAYSPDEVADDAETGDLEAGGGTDNGSEQDNDQSPTTSQPQNESSSQSSVAAQPAKQEPPVPQCGVVSIEPELLDLTGAWKVNEDKATGGRYISWEGLSAGRNNGKPTDVLEIQFAIEKAGQYRFTWAMRQPDGVKNWQGDDSWVNFPDANRFGPVSGGSFDGFVFAEGRSSGTFDYDATGVIGDDKEQMELAIVFHKPGYYTMQLGGRSHGHQIDRILLRHRSIGEAKAIVSPCATTPMPRSVLSPGETDFEPDQDLVSLHFDHAPGGEDAQGAAAARELVTRYNLRSVVVNGTYGTNKDRYDAASEEAMNGIWGEDGWINAHDNREGAVKTIVEQWRRTLDEGGDVWVVEAGPSDVTAQVTKRLQNIMADIDTKTRIHVVQSATWSERRTTQSELEFIKANTDYITPDDGNTADNDTADLNRRSRTFEAAARSGWHAQAWDTAFAELPATERVDFSDMVGFLHILGVDKSTIGSVDDFADIIIQGPTNEPDHNE